MGLQEEPEGNKNHRKFFLSHGSTPDAILLRWRTTSGQWRGASESLATKPPADPTCSHRATSPQAPGILSMADYWEMKGPFTGGKVAPEKVWMM
ncbi:hypothetical protein RUM44_004211 [Polyplax serrata]|uniref:Uncharacterized protein n=1 Tax=Polyplax serrata TaxID=468196 RepID=A0ABR1B275_POLSC